MASEWEASRLGDCVTHQKGFAFKSADYRPNGHPIVRVSNFTDRSIDLAECSYLDHDGVQQYEAYKLRHCDAVIATVGSWPTNPASVVGKTICVPDKADGALLNQNAVRLRTKGDLEQRFLFYLLKQPDFQTYIVGTAQGSASQASVTLNDIFGFKFQRPPLPEQRAIAHILGTLDDKIELNRRMNQTLEGIARALFKSWFVDFDPVHAKAEGRQPAGMDTETAALFPHSFQESKLGLIPEGWEIASLGKVGGNPRHSISPSDIDGNTPYVGLDHIPRKSLALQDWGAAGEVVSGKSTFTRKDILFGKLRPYFHKVVIAPVDGVCSTDILVLRPQSSEWFGFFAFHASSEELVAFADGRSTGTRMPRTNWKDISNYSIALPPSRLAAKFNDLTDPIIERLLGTHGECRTLAVLRDTLLPKLISGQLRVPDADKLLADSPI